MSKRGVWQLRRVVLRYCQHGGSSRGAREALGLERAGWPLPAEAREDPARSAVAAFTRANPQLTLAAEQANGMHPTAVAQYANGRERTVALRNEDVEGAWGADSGRAIGGGRTAPGRKRLWAVCGTPCTSAFLQRAPRRRARCGGGGAGVCMCVCVCVCVCVDVAVSRWVPVRACRWRARLVRLTPLNGAACCTLLQASWATCSGCGTSAAARSRACARALSAAAYRRCRARGQRRRTARGRSSASLRKASRATAIRQNGVQARAACRAH